MKNRVEDKKIERRMKCEEGRGRSKSSVLTEQQSSYRL